MSTSAATKDIVALIKGLRSFAPRRPLTYGESIQLARRQAAYLRRWARADEPDINLVWLLEQKEVPVHLVPSHKLGEESGVTTNAVGDRLQIFLNRQDIPTRQRFSALHEMKHWIDWDDAEVLHAKLGVGDPELRKSMIEWVANEFAAHVLMPTVLVKRTWFRCQDLTTMANLFNVSPEAMETRLKRLGLTDEPEPRTTRPRAYFRAGYYAPLDLDAIDELTAAVA